MSVESDFYSAVTGDAGVSALIGTRCYPLTAPDNATFPLIVYFVISETTIGGTCKRTRIQADLYTESYSGLIALKAAFQTLVDGKVNWGFVGGSDAWEMDSSLYRRVIDVMIS